MLYKNSPDVNFEKKFDYGFVLTPIAELKKGYEVKIILKGEAIEAEKQTYKKE